MPVELECAFCGEVVLKPPSRAERSENHFCDHDCYANWREGRGEKPLTLRCDYCEEEFERFPSHLQENQANHFCSYECRGRWLKTNRPETDCAYCEATIKRIQSKIDAADQHFCSRECQLSWMKENATYDWNSTPNYGSMWKRRRTEVLERDEWTCQGCGRHKNDLGYTPRVHHIQPFSSFSEDQLEVAHDPSNLVALCEQCHNRWEGIPLRPWLD
jgi:5-methylcytosine-specific restriction endonuclease McrA